MALAVAGCSAPGASEAQPATSTNRVVLTAEQACRNPIVGLNAQGPCWTPSAAQVQQAEIALPAYLAASGRSDASSLSARVATYSVQMFGAQRQGRPVLVVNAFCRSQGEGIGRWVIPPPMDGGACYFRAFYDPTTATYVALQVNGEA